MALASGPPPDMEITPDITVEVCSNTELMDPENLAPPQRTEGKVSSEQLPNFHTYQVVCSAVDLNSSHMVNSIWTKNKSAAGKALDAAATAKLLELLSSDKYLQMSSNCQNKKSVLWKLIAEDMCESGFPLDKGKGWQKCDQKFRNLEKQYKDYLQHCQGDMDDVKNPPEFYDELHSLFTKKTSDFVTQTAVDSISDCVMPGRIPEAVLVEAPNGPILIDVVADYTLWSNNKTHEGRALDKVATEKLLQLVSLEENQAMYNDPRKKKCVFWEHIALEMRNSGFAMGNELGGQKCNQKFRNLERQYREFVQYKSLKRKNSVPEFYDSMHILLGKKYGPLPCSSVSIQEETVMDSSGVDLEVEIDCPAGHSYAQRETICSSEVAQRETIYSTEIAQSETICSTEIQISPNEPKEIKLQNSEPGITVQSSEPGIPQLLQLMREEQHSRHEELNDTLNHLINTIERHDELVMRRSEEKEEEKKQFEEVKRMHRERMEMHEQLIAVLTDFKSPNKRKKPNMSFE